MGNTESKKNSYVLSANTHNFVYKKNYQLTKHDYSYLCNETKQSVEQIDKIFDDFFDTNKKGILEKKDFIELYCNLRLIINLNFYSNYSVEGKVFYFQILFWVLYYEYS